MHQAENYLKAVFSKWLDSASQIIQDQDFSIIMLYYVLILTFVGILILCCLKYFQPSDPHPQTAKQGMNQIKGHDIRAKNPELAEQTRKVLEAINSLLPIEKKKQLNGQRGLKNIGNTCYMNTALQCLHKSRYFTHEIQKAPQSNQTTLTHHYSQLIDKLWLTTSSGPTTPGAIKQKVAQKNFLFQYSAQNDAVQFLSSFLSVINDQNDISPKQKNFQTINRMKDKKRNLQQHQILEMTIRNDNQRTKSLVQNVFTGRYRTSYICRECNFDYVLFQKFNVHNLKIPSSKAPPFELAQCLQQFSYKELLYGENKMFCDRCEKDTENQKTMEILMANKVLVLRIERFLNNRKDQRKVNIALQLKPEQIMPKMTYEIYKNKIYRLYAACLHSGSLTNGHYVAECLNYYTNQWMYYSDQHYRVIKQPKFDNAYAVFYELCQMDENIKKVK